MAAVLDALASNVTNMLTEMAKEEVGMLLGVSGEIDRLTLKLEGLRDFLADAERRRITDQHVQRWVRELKDAMYDITDILELCQLKAMEDKKRRGNNPLLFCLQNPLRAHDIGRRIKELNRQLDGIKERAGQFSFIRLDAYDDLRRTTGEDHGARRTAPGLDRSGVVGKTIEHDTNKLVEMLTTENEEGCAPICIVAIVGVGGIGKTTLAQNTFNHRDIEEKFHKRIWLSINQDFSKPELLRTAISHAGGDHREYQEPSLLEPILQDVLRGKTVLLVMDDIWDVNAWSKVLSTPLVNAVAQGSRVLITTRDERVAQEMKAVQPYRRVGILSQEDAWSLLKKQVVSTKRDENVIEKLKSTGLRIIERCGGLPLAIKAIAGVLSHKEINESEWGKVLRSHSWSWDGMPEELNCAIYLSYDDLQAHLKQCLLYCSLFPTYNMPPKSLIIDLWISEGFVNGKSNELEELGKEYYNELILRNLMQTKPPNGCIMHDVIRSFCQHVAKDDALSSHMGKPDLSGLDSKKYRWLVVENALTWKASHEQKSARTLFLFGRNIKFETSDLSSKFSNLRVLHIVGVQFTTSIDSLCQLKNMRNLYLVSTGIRCLPDGIGMMKLLEYIGLVRLICEEPFILPGSITKLQRLRCVSLLGTNINFIPRGFGRLTNLRKIISFPAQMDGSSSKEEWCSLEELGSLSQLRELSLKGLEVASSSSLAAKAKLSAKEHLTFLWLECNDRQAEDGLLKEEEVISMEEERRIEKVFDELCPPPSLDVLVIKGYFGQRLPRWMASTVSVTLDKLTSLTMDGLPRCTEFPSGLCLLPCLKSLVIKRAPAIKHIGHEFLQAQHNGNCHPSRAGAAVAFPRLDKLDFIAMVEWEEWEWEEHIQAMPLLEVLLLERCKLGHLPLGLASHARALRILKVFRVQRLNSLQNFSSLVELQVCDNPDMEKITNLPKLKKLIVVHCPMLTVLENMPALQNLILKDFIMKTLPGYLRDVKPRSLVLDCSLALLSDISMGDSSSEWDKISHIQQIRAFADEMRYRRKWYVFRTGDPIKLETNIVCSSISRGIIQGMLIDKEKHVKELRMVKLLYALLAIGFALCLLIMIID